jgi:hypothetical protein
MGTDPIQAARVLGGRLFMPVMLGAVGLAIFFLLKEGGSQASRLAPRRPQSNPLVVGGNKGTPFSVVAHPRSLPAYDFATRAAARKFAEKASKDGGPPCTVYELVYQQVGKRKRPLSYFKVAEFVNGKRDAAQEKKWAREIAQAKQPREGWAKNPRRNSRDNSPQAAYMRGYNTGARDALSGKA